MKFRDVILTFTSVIMTLCTAHSGHQHAPPAQPVGSFHEAGKDENHIKEHMQHEMNTQRQMTPQEMEFHYFRLHDTNNDTMLDGLEILQALSHMLPPNLPQPHEVQGKTEAQIEALKQERQMMMFQNYVDIIDKVLRDDDLDGNGYLTYPEYVVARRRDEQRMRQQHEEMMKHGGAPPPGYQPGYQQPPQGYQQPPQGYQQPPQGYHQPPQGYQQPPQGYQQPPQGYQQPPHQHPPQGNQPPQK